MEITIALQANAKNMIDTHEWNVGAATYDTQALNYYNSEVGTTINANVGIMNASDYAYAAESSCWTTSGYSYNSSCASKDWTYLGSNEWTITPYSGNSYEALFVRSESRVLSTSVRDSLAVRPAVYLKSTVKGSKGFNEDGSSDHPYELTI